MSYGYGGQANPFDDRAGADNGGGYGGGLPSGPRGGAPRNNGYGGGNDEYGGGYDGNQSNTVEMASLTQNASTFGLSNPNALLNECADIGKGIDSIDKNLNQMKMLQDRSLNEADSSASGTTRQLDSLSSETMALYRTLVERVRQLKSNPEAKSPKNGPQVQRIDRRLKEAINSYQQVEAQFRKKNQDQMARQYRIVRPDADESEVRAAVDDPTAQVFQQALMQSNRRGQAQSVLNAVQDRHAQLQKIEQQLIELAQLFQDMDTLVVQQEELVTNIEQKAEETVENFDKGNEEIGTAITTARATRKKKWICLGIVVAIILIIAIVVVVYIFINKGSSSSTNKRDIKATLHRGSLAGRAWDNSDPLPQMLTRRENTDDLVTRFIEDAVKQTEKRDIKLFRGETARSHARSWQDARIVDTTGKVELEEMMS